MSAGLKLAILAAVGVVVLLVVIGAIVASLGTGPTPGPTPGPTQGPGPGPTSEVFNASGFWMDPNGNRFTVQHDGSNFSASGFVPGYGIVTIQGTLTTAAARFVMRTGSGIVISGGGAPYICNAGMPHLRYQLADGTVGDFKINHVR